MKKLKGWLIALSIIFVGGLVTSAGIAGHVYFNEMKIYENSREENIDLSNIKNMYINSDVPVSIQPTEGKPRVELYEKFEDFLGNHPEHEIKVEKQGTSAYITIEQTKDVEIWVGVKSQERLATIYLPQLALDELRIEGEESYYGSGRGINLTGVDVKNLDIDVAYSEIMLDGQYENVDINSYNGSIKMDSKTPAQINITGRASAQLAGKFKSIEMESAYRLDVNSDSATTVKVLNANGTINLKGSYNKIDLAGNGADISIDSVEPYIAEISNQGSISLNGALERANIRAPWSEVTIQSTISPSALNILERPNKLTMTFPSNISGLLIKYGIDEYTDMYGIEDLDYLEEYNQEVTRYKQVISDYTLVAEKDAKGMLTNKYGDGATKVYIEPDYNTIVRIMDGGYNSKSIGTNP